MRGRNAINRKNNKPLQRQKDLYELLIEIGEESQWKDLKAITLKRLKWSPTKLKKTLDELIENKLVIKEPRLGKKGAEVWYLATTKANLLKLALRIAQPFISIETEKQTDEFGIRFLAGIREKASKLQGNEKEDYLRKNLHVAIHAYGVMSHLIPFFITLRTAKMYSLDKSQAKLNYALIQSHTTRQDDDELLDLLLEYPKLSMEVIDQLYREPYKPLSVQPRSLEPLFDSEESALKWVESLKEVS